jgi:hypothetical protein
MSVVERCPNCGTTQATAGECEACHEAQVRYFCTNHTPGLWLDASTCPSCGARFGESPPARAPAAPQPTPSDVPDLAFSARTRSTGPARRPEASLPPARPRARSRTPRAGAWSERERPLPADDESLERSASGLPPWQKLLLSVLRARYMPSVTTYRARPPAIARSAGGCLMRLVMIVVLLFVALAGAVFLFGRTLLQGY